MPRLCDCGHSTNLAGFLDSTPAEAVGSSGHAGLTCPACGAAVELVLDNGRILLGYTYAAGSPHFERVREVKVPKLRVAPGDPDDLDVHLGTRHWHFGVRRPSHLRFVVLRGAWASGRRLGDLDFRTMGVEVEVFERDWVKVAPDMEVVVQEGDFLHLCGPYPALTRAWFYMNDGPG